MKLVLKITLGIILAAVLLSVGCSALIASSADDIQKEIDKTQQRWDQQEKDYYACAEGLDISDPHYMTKLDDCADGLYQ